MKRFLFLPLLAALLVFLPSCGEEQTEPTAPVATIRATRSPATPGEAASTAATTAAETTAPVTTVPVTTAKKSTAATVPTTRVAATSKPVQDNIPADTITAAHINPAIGSIQSYVQSEVDALAVTGISLSDRSLTLEQGTGATVDVAIEPSYAIHKKCSVSTSSDCVKATYNDGAVTILAVKAGTATVTVTTHNGISATVEITVTARPDDKSEPTTEEPPLPTEEETTVATEPAEEPTE